MRSLLFFCCLLLKTIYIGNKRMETEFMETEINSLTGMIINTAKTGTETVVAIIATIFVVLAAMMVVKTVKETKTKKIEFKKINANKYNKHDEYGFKCDGM